MAKLNYSYSGSQIKIGEKVHSFPTEIIKVLEHGDNILVLISYYPKIDRAIYYFDKLGNLIWQIHELPFKTKSWASFTGVSINERNEIIAYNTAGGDFTVNPENGEVSMVTDPSGRPVRSW